MGCSAVPQHIQYLFYRPIEVTRGEWQVLDLGKPVDPLKFEVVDEGTGQVVEPGDLILVSLNARLIEQNKVEDDGDWWIWVGFRTKEETPFHSINLRLVSAFVGLKEGSSVKFIEPSHYNTYAGQVSMNPFGNFDYYANQKSGYAKKWRAIYVPTSSGYTVVHIKKVFKGQLKYRTTHLYDDSWFHYCNAYFECKYSDTPRNAEYVDARYEGVSVDGKRAIFRYGPVSSEKSEPWRPSSSLRGFFTLKENEWNNLPIGVQVE